MKLADKIAYRLIGWAQGTPTDIMLPNFYLERHECDLFKLRASGYITEYEIKISRSDFFADFKKSVESWRTERTNISKHEELKNGKRHTNRFFFVVPDGLIQVSEVPDHCGLIYYKNDWFSTVKNAPLLHKRKYDKAKLVNTLAGRELSHRNKLRVLQHNKKLT